jgi:H+/Cl- antiporter ClcA/CBS domain-containing protein
MAPLVLVGSVITHLFGGSAGREGTAVQMGASLADTLRRVLRLNAPDRRLMIMAGISGGFGSVFGVPVAGFVFGMEVQQVGRIRYEGIIPCLIASCVGDLVTRAWGAPHTHYPQMPASAIDPLLLAKVLLAGVLFGLTSLLFIELTHAVRRGMQRLSKWTPLHPLLGGSAIIVLTLLVGTQDYLGLSLPLIQHSLDGSGVVAQAFLLKLIFTALTLGSGFLGGEVTPLFVIGSTLGYTLAAPLGIDPAFLASIGFVAVFAGAANTPLACALMGIELFGGGAALYLFAGCAVAYLASGHRGIYMTQILSAPKASVPGIREGENLHSIAQRDSGAAARIRQPQNILADHPVTVREQDAFVDVLAAARQGGVNYVPVVNQSGALVGVIQAAALTAHADADAVAADIMIEQVAAIGHHATISGALAVMQADNLSIVAIIDGAGRIVGIITR